MNLPRFAIQRLTLLGGPRLKCSPNGATSMISHNSLKQRLTLTCGASYHHQYQLYSNYSIKGNTSPLLVGMKPLATSVQEAIVSSRKRWSSGSWMAYNQLFPSTSTMRLIHTSGSNDNELQQKEKLLPPLMPFPPIVWPKFINAIRNWFFINFIIKPYFDKDFQMNDFLLGVKEAVSVVANKLSEGKLDELEGLVEPSALAQIKESISKFTVFQQQLLRVAAEDVFFAFPYQIGIIIPDETPSDSDRFVEGAKPPPQTRHVEITVCLHVLRGLAEKQRGGETGSSFNFQEFTQDERNKYNVMICNYRFFKDFTEGSTDPSWIVNMVNHFLPAEIR